MVFPHSAFKWQLCTPLLHSSTSAKVRMNFNTMQRVFGCSLVSQPADIYSKLIHFCTSLKINVYTYGCNQLSAIFRFPYQTNFVNNTKPEKGEKVTCTFLVLYVSSPNLNCEKLGPVSTFGHIQGRTYLCIVDHLQCIPLCSYNWMHLQCWYKLHLSDSRGYHLRIHQYLKMTSTAGVSILEQF